MSTGSGGKPPGTGSQPGRLPADTPRVVIGASRDGAHFAEPESFEPSRTNARDHLAFSFGVPHCLGAALARVELQELLRAILDKWANVALFEPITWKHAKLPIWGPSSIRMAVTPA